MPVAIPERIKKIHAFLSIFVICVVVFWKKTIPQVKRSITEVLMAVAKLLSTFLMPIFAKIETRAAKTADKKAAIYQGIRILLYKN